MIIAPFDIVLCFVSVCASILKHSHTSVVAEQGGGSLDKNGINGRVIRLLLRGNLHDRRQQSFLVILVRHDKVTNLLSLVLRNHDDSDVVALDPTGENLTQLLFSCSLIADQKVLVSLLVTLAHAGKQETSDCKVVSAHCDEHALGGVGHLCHFLRYDDIGFNYKECL